MENGVQIGSVKNICGECKMGSVIDILRYSKKMGKNRKTAYTLIELLFSRFCPFFKKSITDRFYTRPPPPPLSGAGSSGFGGGVGGCGKGAILLAGSLCLVAG